MPNYADEFQPDMIPPQNLEAEQAALGGMMLERFGIDWAMDNGVVETWFYREAHRLIFCAIMDVHCSGEPADLITVGTLLRDRNQLDLVGGTTYLTTLMSQVPTGAGVPVYCDRVRTCYLRREMIRRADTILRRAYNFDEDITEQIGASEADMQRLAELCMNGGVDLPDLYTVMQRSIAQRKAQDSEGVELGFRSPFRGLNRHLLSFKPGEVIVIGARPSMGKSALGVQLALHAAQHSGQVGVIFSMEMDSDSIAMRLFQAHCTQQDGTPLNAWMLNSMAYRRENPLTVYTHGMEAVADDMRGVRLRMGDVSSLKPSELEHACRVIRREEGRLDFVVIDYLQLMDADGQARGNTFETIRQVSRAMKKLAMAMHCTVFPISQLSRNVESRTPRRPQLSDLRESGQIEQDADKVLLLYRPGYYGADEMARAARHDETDTEVILAKQRNGPAGISSWLTFNPKRVWFEESAEQGGEG